MTKSKIKPRSLAPIANRIIKLHESVLKEMDTLESIRYSKSTSKQALNTQILRYISAKTLLLKKIAQADDIVENEIADFISFEQPTAQTTNA